jgi:hypothetical protein
LEKADAHSSAITSSNTCGASAPSCPYSHPCSCSMCVGGTVAVPSQTLEFRDDTNELPRPYSKRHPRSVRSPLIDFHMMDEIGRKHPVHLEVRDRRETPIIVYLTVCTKRVNQSWQIQQRMNSCELGGEKRGYGSSGVTSSCLTTFIYFARQR